MSLTHYCETALSLSLKLGQRKKKTFQFFKSGRLEDFILSESLYEGGFGGIHCSLSALEVEAGRLCI